MYALLQETDRVVHIEHLYHLLFQCVVISNKFPRLLAEREIIANALFFPICLAAHFCLAFRMDGGDNSAKVLLYFEIRGMNVDFSLGKACGL